MFLGGMEGTAGSSAEVQALESCGQLSSKSMMLPVSRQLGLVLV